MSYKKKGKQKGEVLNVDFGSGLQSQKPVVSDQQKQFVPTFNKKEETKIEKPPRQVFQMNKEEIKEESNIYQRQIFQKKQSDQNNEKPQNQLKKNDSVNDGKQPQEKLQEAETMQFDLDPQLKDEILSRYQSTNDFQCETRSEAITLIFESVGSALKQCPVKQTQPLPSHIFGEQKIQPLIPPITVGISKDSNNFVTEFSRCGKLPAGEVLARLLNQQEADSQLLDHLFKNDISQLQKKAACDAFQLDAGNIMSPCVQKVFEGICKNQEISTLGVEQHVISLEHDPATGRLSKIKYSEVNDDDENIEEQFIEDLLSQAQDPFANLEFEQTSLLIAGQKFLNDFKLCVAKQIEQDQKLASQIKKDGKGSEPQDQEVIDNVKQESSDEQVKEEEISDIQDEIDQIVQSSDAYKAALQPVKVVASERNNKNLIQQLADNKEQTWVITDNINVSNFSEMIQNPALEFNFELDDFQKRAIYRLEQGQNVMVAAHTSAGKTAVAEYAIALSRLHMTKTIYTSPIKSLSNQKYRDFKLKFGDVGVVTGDVQLNQKAQCLIMTTEVLQSMLYNNTEKISDVEWVIFDEVHYINDPERGSVWEEVIMKLPDTVNIIMLSATVPNYIDFANWVGRTKQKKVYVQYTDKRPVPLMHNFMLEGQITLIKEHEKACDKKAMNEIVQDRKQKQYAKKDDKTDKTKIDLDKLSKEEKKIDFKAKAIKAKEGSMKKMLASSKKISNEGGGSKGPNSGQVKKKANSINKTILQIQKMKLLPAIVFAFSRAGTFELASGLDATVDFTDGYTKGLIKKFVKQKLQRLDEVDRELPQIKAVTDLLYRGIGVHHAGLLQLMKELVEILFSDGYLKIVFATSTFAIGLNLPARCVVFTQMRKFNGTEICTISTSEYLQMAGRAGRRGKDDKGHSIICMDPDLGSIPSKAELQDLLDSKGVLLESQLKIDYSTCLNVLKQEAGEIESLIQNSFFADEDMKTKLQSMKQKKKIEPFYEKSRTINCVHNVPEQAQTLYDLVDQLWEANHKLNINEAPQLLQVVEVTTAKHILKTMVVVKVQARSCLCLYTQKFSESWPLSYDVKNQDESLQHLQKLNAAKTVSVPEIYSYEYVEVDFDFISKFYLNRVSEIDKIQFTAASVINEKQLKVIIREFSQIKILQEKEIQGKSKKNIQNFKDEQAEIIAKIKSTKCWGCDYLSYHQTQMDYNAEFKQEMQKLNKILDGGVTDKEQEFQKRNSVLQDLKYLDSDLNLLFKGKVATKAGNDLLLTEFFFSGLINELNDVELLALISVFETREKAGKNAPDCAKIYSDSFGQGLQFLKNETEKMFQMEVVKGVTSDEETVDSRLNLKFYEVVYDWADQKSFAEATQDRGIEEGIIVKQIMSVNRIRHRLQDMATFVGDNSLAERLKEMEALVDRGIVKMQSLYLEIEQEPPRLNYFE